MSTKALAPAELEKKIATAEKKALKEQGLREEMEYEAEEEAARGRSMVMTGANDAVESLGSFAAAKIAVAMPGAEKPMMAIGGLVQILRPFTEHSGYARLATALPHGMFQGSLAISVYKSGTAGGNPE